MVEEQDAEVLTALSAAVEAVGGQRREGQVEMAGAVADALVRRQHLMVQAGTGTGKSLAYLVPGLLHHRRVVVATATLALQHQLIDYDLPRVTGALAEAGAATDDELTYAVLKGRSNYACLHRIREGVPDEQGALVEAPTGSMGAEVIKLREWAEQEAEAGGDGDKDAAPRHQDRAWRQVSVSSRECIGATRCEFAEECFAERAKDKAAKASLIVTNHALLSIDAIEGIPMIPEYDAVIVDEAHELTSRVTNASTAELSAGEIDRAAKRIRRHVKESTGGSNPADDLADAGDGLADAIATCDSGRMMSLPDGLEDALALVRDSARSCMSAMIKDEGEADAGKVQAKSMVQEVFATAERLSAHQDSDVVWRTEGTDRFPPRLCVAPLSVSLPIREHLLGEATVVFTSATLKLGGDFRSVAHSVGLQADEQVDEADPGAATSAAEPWRGLDVGSPFDYQRQGILYTARDLDPPGRDGLAPASLQRIVDLVDAADGRTLGLFSSRRAAEQAAEHVRTKLPHLTTLAQGDAQMPELKRQFAGDPHTNLFGTLGLWQGLDFPGDTCRIVLIDRIPFPRPDDPVLSARQQAVAKAGGNGFMQVAASHAALLLAQGSGRLIRSFDDKGVVAVLDSRLATARYGSFLLSSMPPMWRTSDQAMVTQALARLIQSSD